MKVYTAINRDAWLQIKNMLGGVCFSREEKGTYYLKMPSKYAKQLIQTGAIQQYKEDE